MLTFNAEGLMQKIGVAATAVKSAERKDMGSPFRALTPEERAIFQSVIDDLHRQFVAKVVERRKLPEATRAHARRRPRLHRASRPSRTSSIDRIGYMPDAIELARQAAGVDEGAGGRVPPAPPVPRDVLRGGAVGRGRRAAVERRARRADGTWAQVPVSVVAVRTIGESAAV